MENYQMWQFLRDEGKILLDAPKHKEAVAKLKGTKGKLAIPADVKSRIRKDILIRDSEFSSPEAAENYAERHYKDFKDFSYEELDWLERWSISYLVACNGGVEMGEKHQLPEGITDADCLLYIVLGGIPPESWIRDYRDVSYSLIFTTLRRMRRVEIREKKQEVIRKYLVEHPDGDGELLKNKIPMSFSEIAGDVEPFELMTFWRNHRYNPKRGRRGITYVMEEFRTRNGRLPKDGEECIPIIREKEWTSILEDRIISGVDRRLRRKEREERFRSMERELVDAD